MTLPFRRLLAALLLLAGLALSPLPAAASLLHLEGPVPADLGVRDGALSPCTAPAHCRRADWPVADAAAALQTLLPVVRALPGAEVEAADGTYLHATVRSRLFGFVDDLELHAAGEVLQARSASRLGDSDLGVNGRRLDGLQRALADAVGDRPETEDLRP